MTTVDTATQAGAEHATDEGARPKSAREVMMEHLGERHEQVLAEQTQQQAPAPTVATEGEAVLVDDPKRFKLRVKIGDREEEQSLDAVMNELRSSQGRLRSLSQREKELAAALAEKDRLIEQQLAAQMTASPATDEEIDARAAEIVGAIAEGEEDKAIAALRDVLRKGRQSATPVDATALVGQVKDELAKEQAAAQNATVWETFLADHPEFSEQVDDAGNVILSEERQYGDFLFERDFKPRIEAGEISYQQALIETAEAVKKTLAGKTGQDDANQADKDPFQERQERKRQLDNLPVAAGARSQGAAPATDESHADIIREMRKARGLPA